MIGMAMQDRDRRALTYLAGALLVAAIVWFWPQGEDAAAGVVAAPVGSTEALEQQLHRLRKKEAEAPAKAQVAKDIYAQLKQRERGLIVADTLAQAQAQLAQVLRQTGRAQGMDFRAVSMVQPRIHGGEYGEILLTAGTECRIEQLVNFLADLTKRGEIVSTEEFRITSANVKEKTLMVQLTLGALVPKRLVPEKKGI